MRQRIKCYRCGYDLRGLQESRKCPECGASIAESARRAKAKPKWTPRRQAVVAAWTIGILILAVLNLIIIGPDSSSRTQSVAVILVVIWGLIALAGYVSLILLALMKRAPFGIWVAFALGMAWSVFATLANALIWMGYFALFVVGVSN